MPYRVVPTAPGVSLTIIDHRYIYTLYIYINRNIMIPIAAAFLQILCILKTLLSKVSSRGKKKKNIRNQESK